jgi:DNA-binding CsgD family transcriptional regulator/catechol-2,3-dioxygenase
MAMSARAGRGRPPHDDVLTPAEWRIVHAVQHGMSNREIAARRGISLDAVKFHLDNIRTKLELRDRQSLKRWFRSPKGSALDRQERTMTTVQLGAIGQIARSVRDIGRAERWYRDVLGLPHLYTFGKLAFFDCAGTRLFLSESETPGPDSLLYFKVADIVSAHAQLQARGIEFVSAPHKIHTHADGTEEWMAFFNDPEGRPLALMAQVKGS